MMVAVLGDLRVRTWAGFLAGAAIVTCPVVSAADELRFTIGDGRVTLIARDAPLGDVLAEWRRAGDTRFVDAGELDEVPVSLHLVDVPEGEALRLLLRPAAGYLAVPRAATAPGASAYDRVKILAAGSGSPAVRPVAAPRAGSAGAASPAGASGAGRPEGGLGDRPPPPELSEEAQIERLQRLLHPRGSGGESAAATGTQPSAPVPLITPRPGMIVDPEQPQTAAEPPRRRYRGSAREYDPFTVFPGPPPR